MSEENKDEERASEERAKSMSEKSTQIATDVAKTFEKWLEDHKDTSKEEAHTELVKTIEAAMMMHTIILMMS